MKRTIKALGSVMMVLVMLVLAIPITTYAAEATTPTGIPLSEIESRIDELVATYMHEFTPGLAVAVVHDGEIVFSRGYGYADIARQIAVDPATTVFEYGSITKLFVYVSVMQLVEQGLLDLDADIHNYLSEDLVRQFNFRYSFTMRDLLNHSAGFGEFHFNAGQDAENVTTRSTLREALIATQPLQIFEPGTSTAYSNFSSALAAYIVSHISRQEFSDFERANILNPLGMNNTRNQPDWFDDDVFMQPHARGHLLNANGNFNEVPLSYVSAYPAGAMRGTVEDLAKFAIALMPLDGESGPLFNNRYTLDLMLSPSYDTPRILKGTGHGFFTYDGLYTTIGHGGGTTGFTSQFAIVPSHDFGVVILTNTRNARGFIDKILDVLVGNTRDSVPHSPENLPNAARLAGNFVSLSRNEGNVLEAMNRTVFDTHIQIAAVDENTIVFKQSGDVITYRQVEPYVFRAVSANTSHALAMTRNMYELHFIMENGQPVRISTSSFIDFTAETFRQSALASSITTALDAISILYFLIIPMILLIKFLRSKEKRHYYFNLLSNGLLLCGTLFMINSIVLMVRISTADFLTTAQVTPHTWINYILLALSAVLLIASVVCWKKNTVTIKRRILFFSTVTLLALLVANLWYWNFFVMM